MFEELSNDDVSKALSELVNRFGVKEDIPLDSLCVFLRNKDAQGCIQKIANLFDLPIRINLSFIPKDFKPGYANGFRSTSLVKTDWTGRGSESIIAQVTIPESLPMFGTAELRGYLGSPPLFGQKVVLL